MTTLNAALKKLEKNGFTVTIKDYGDCAFYSFTKPGFNLFGKFYNGIYDNDDISLFELYSNEFRKELDIVKYQSFNKLVAAVVS